MQNNYFFLLPFLTSENKNERNENEIKPTFIYFLSFQFQKASLAWLWVSYCGNIKNTAPI